MRKPFFKLFFFFNASILFLGSSSLSQAALPPYYESVRIIRAILDSSEIAEKLGLGDPIEKIFLKQAANKNSPAFYQIQTSSCTAQIEVHYSKQKIMGPAAFQIKLSQKDAKPDCKPMPSSKK